MKRPLSALILILAVASLACSVSVNLPEPKTGPTQTLEVSEGFPDAYSSDLFIGMGGGKLDMRPGGDKLVEGTVEYNVEDWKPDINRTGSEVKIEQTVTGSFIGSKVINNWDLRLGNKPLSLTIQAGAYESKLDLSGVPLKSLHISDGASKATVVFNQPNPIVMSNFTYTTGASSIDLQGLLNANFEEMNFKGGAGNFSLDFSGAMTRDVKVFIDGGLGNITLVIPKGVNARIDVSGGLNNVSTEGKWTIEGQQYTTIGAEGPLLKLEVNVGIGNLRLENK